MLLWNNIKCSVLINPMTIMVSIQQPIGWEGSYQLVRAPLLKGRASEMVTLLTRQAVLCVSRLSPSSSFFPEQPLRCTRDVNEGATFSDFPSGLNLIPVPAFWPVTLHCFLKVFSYQVLFVLFYEFKESNIMCLFPSSNVHFPVSPKY